MNYKFAYKIQISVLNLQKQQKVRAQKINVFPVKKNFAFLFTLLGTVFVSALKAIAPILVFVLVISALVGGNDKLDRRLGLVIAFYLVSTLLV